MKWMIMVCCVTVSCFSAMAQGGQADRRKPVPSREMHDSSATSEITSSNSSPVTAKDIVIHPSPVKGSDFSLELLNLDKGKYSILVYDRLGKKHFIRTFEFEGGVTTENIHLPSKLGSGTYILQVLNKSSRYSKKLVLE